MDWARASLWAFFRGPVLQTPEGWLFLGGSLLCFLFSALYWLVPGMLPRPELATGHAILFMAWPFALLTIYVSLCSPDFRRSLMTTVMVFCAAAFPF
jgi:hypothetical protein